MRKKKKLCKIFQNNDSLKNIPDWTKVDEIIDGYGKYLITFQSDKTLAAQYDSLKARLQAKCDESKEEEKHQAGKPMQEKLLHP